MKIFPDVPGDLAKAGSRRLRRFIAESVRVVDQITDDPDQYLSDEFTSEDLFAEMESGVTAIETVRAELARRAQVEETEGEDGDEDEGGEEAEPEGEAASESVDTTAKLTELAARARAEAEPEPEGEEGEEGDGDEDAEGEEAVTAAGELPVMKAVRRMPKPVPSHKGVESTALQPLVAAAEGFGVGRGDPVDSETIAKMMIAARRDFGTIAEGTETKVPIARADWSDSYDQERTLTADADINWGRINRVIDEDLIKRNMQERRAGKSLTASGGLCAPVTPYYQLQMISQANRPVRAALPSFNADRGGLRFAAPAALSAVTTAVGVISEAEDSAGGSLATKTCQVIPCPEFSEVDVATIYHCLQFGNLGARTFPELVAQWNSLVLAAHARLAETVLLDGIGGASTQVTAAASGLGATASLFGQVLSAANGMRSRHRMDPEAVLRVMLPDWSLDLLVSDVIRSQFDRWGTTEESVTALLRSFDVEPTFYIDSESGKGQVFGTQSAGALNTFPTTVRWYMYPEGSFLYLDGGVLELGIVRDSVLNSTNDFQIFGESFENVAFVGVESLAVTSTLCDSGAVSLPIQADCPTSWA